MFLCIDDAEKYFLLRETGFNVPIVLRKTDTYSDFTEIKKQPRPLTAQLEKHLLHILMHRWSKQTTVIRANDHIQTIYVSDVTPSWTVWIHPVTKSPL